MIPLPHATVARTAWRQGRALPGKRILPEEAPVAFTYNRMTYAVMLATPADFEDFAIGFSLTQGLIAHPADIEELEVVGWDQGVELRMSLAPQHEAAFVSRRRHLAGPTGCGLCGVESLAEAVRAPPPVVAGPGFHPDQIAAAVAALPGAQTLNRATHAMHAAAFWTASGGIAACAEDVGGHNALDKLAGRLAREGADPAAGILLLSSRVSIELIQKCAAIGIPVMAAISSPTALAVRMAQTAGITLIGVARENGFEVFTHPDRIQPTTRLRQAVRYVA